MAHFVFFREALTEEPKLCVDGLLPGPGIHLSHWEGNRTPAEFKADTSTESALLYASSPARAEGPSLVSNNHFDADGLLSVWAALHPERALPLREVLVAAAEAGDFSERSSDAGLRVSFALQGDGSPTRPQGWRARLGPATEEQVYASALPEVEKLLRDPGAFEPLWRDAWAALARNEESFAAGRSRAHTDPAGLLTVAVLEPALAPDAASLGSLPLHAVAPFARGEWVLVAAPAGQGFHYRIERAFHAWADTVTRPRFPRKPAAPAAQRLDELEGRARGRWLPVRGSMGPVCAHRDERGDVQPSRLEPEVVAAALREVLARSAPRS